MITDYINFVMTTEKNQVTTYTRISGHAVIEASVRHQFITDGLSES